MSAILWIVLVVVALLSQSRRLRRIKDRRQKGKR